MPGIGLKLSSKEVLKMKNKSELEYGNGIVNHLQYERERLDWRDDPGSVNPDSSVTPNPGPEPPEKVSDGA